MKENNLVASVALFSELYNSNKYSSPADIIAEFIKAAIITENVWETNATDINSLLAKVYNFHLPDSVIKTTLRTKCKGLYTVQVNGNLLFNENVRKGYEEIHNKYENIAKIQSSVNEALVDFVKQKTNIDFTANSENEIISSLHNFLFDKSIESKYTSVISAFILSNKSNETFTENLNLIREGIILYQGIKYTADINELGKWNTELTIFLSTEHLFNCIGYNGSLFEQIFSDFFTLVSEINLTGKNKYGEKLIKLRYFEETAKAVDAYFLKAENFMRGRSINEFNQPALLSILKGCKTPSDIVNKKITFFNLLKEKDILQYQIKQNIYNYSDYVVEGQNFLDELQKESKNAGHDFFDVSDAEQILKLFTKINYLRDNNNAIGFENIGHIYITADRFTLYLANAVQSKMNNEYVPFAKNIDYITNKFWFKLKKGFAVDSQIPISFNVVTKAQVVLSGQVKQRVSQAFIKI